VYSKSLVFERKVDTRGTPFVALSVRPHALLTKTTVAMLKQAIFRIKAEEVCHFELFMAVRTFSFNDAVSRQDNTASMIDE